MANLSRIKGRVAALEKARFATSAPLLVIQAYDDEPERVVEDRIAAAGAEALASAGLPQWPPGVSPIVVVIKKYRSREGGRPDAE
jgi:hypothetical protein